tara:strand:+ start:232 stop:885 length:654 start_codon:yes stop_codon:yes gene_type:complete
MVDLAENREVEGGYAPEWVKLSVVSVAAVVDRSDIPQWQLAVRWPWTNKYDDVIYVYQDKSPKTISPGDEYLVLAQKEYRKTNKSTGEVYDGDLGWMFKWRILEWDADTSRVEAPQPPVAQPERPAQPAPVQEAPPAPVPAPAPVVRVIEENQMRIMRQATLKCASWMMVPLMKEFSNPLLAVQRTEELSEMFMEYVISGKVKIADETPDPVDEWEA